MASYYYSSKGEKEDNADASSIPSAHLSFLFNAAGPMSWCPASNETLCTSPVSEEQLQYNAKPFMRFSSPIDENVKDEEENDIASFSEGLHVQYLRDINSLTNSNAFSQCNETASAYIIPKSQAYRRWYQECHH